MARPLKNVKRFSSNLQVELYKQLHDYACMKGMTLTGVLELALKEYMFRHPAEQDQILSK